MTDSATLSSQAPSDSPWRIFLIFLRLGLTSFGGPVAHLGYFRDAFVSRRGWLDERSYADLVALCQFLPGPASSQVGIAIGLLRAGTPGAFAAWAGFTLPSAVALTLFALGLASWESATASGLLHGLKIVAVAVVAQAVWGMARTFCSDGLRIGFAVMAASAALLAPAAWTQLGIILAAGLLGLALFRLDRVAERAPVAPRISRSTGGLLLAFFFASLLILPLLAATWSAPLVALVDTFYRVGALVFGGGHVVLPLLEAEVVTNGWVNQDTFMAGYGAAQAVPGPLFTFAAFLGGAMHGGSPFSAAVCLVAVFAPSFLLVLGVMPFWARLSANQHLQGALAGINAAVVGLLLAALYDPVWTSAVHDSGDFALVLLALAALTAWKLPPWLVVLGGGLVGWWLPGF
ncbi:chromate efflux transporter [Pseudomonas sp. PS1]|uniref:Chromate efflux transporter n=1 Tax=Stutzerimonas marianensis TaxID=2929513 RepID=A0A9X2ASH3_9GAMM|nr:chromate efflux transporter [Pseudomonas marianensis]MCJ0974568.1 chromate efflux transporter [Pseudomonas marianensis]